MENEELDDKFENAPLLNGISDKTWNITHDADGWKAKKEGQMLTADSLPKLSHLCRIEDHK